MDVKEQLLGLAEPEFKNFTCRLMPNVNPDTVTGVRLPKLRKLAKGFAKAGWREYLEGASDDTYEEIMLQGMVIGYGKGSWEEKKPYVTEFLPKIDNWSVCDSFCSGLKFAPEEEEAVWEYLTSCMGDGREYVIRFGVVMALFHYKKEEYAERAFGWFDRIDHPGYYVKMAVAWAVSAFYVSFPEMTEAYLDRCGLDDWTYNKALQKIVESLCVGEEGKRAMRARKRG